MEQVTGRMQSRIIVLLVIYAVCLLGASETTCGAGAPAKPDCDRAVPAGCTVFSISKGHEVFFGGNDDYVDSDSYYWVDPGDADDYGAIWIGRPDNVQQGVNEKGLAYDANGLPRVDVNPHPERVPVSGSYTSYPIRILHDCATVEEVIAWVNTHQWHSYMHDQMHFADATGDAVVISAGADGEVVFTRKSPGDSFLVSTNFNVANPMNAFGYPCWRYDRARELLGRLLSQEGSLTAEDAARVLDAVHQQGGTSWTIASLVADLTNGLVYLYYFYQFDRPVVLRVEEELANPRDPGPLSRLFPDEVRQEAARRFQEIQDRARRCQWVGMIWLAIVAASLILLILLPAGGRLGAGLWVPAVIFIGPLALFVRFVVWRRRQHCMWAVALVEVLGDMVPTVAAFVATLGIVILVRVAQAPGLLQISLVLGLPLALGWLVFHGPLLAPLTDKGYGRFLSRRLPHVLVAANLGLGGISVIAMPLVNWSLRTCSILPLSAWTIITWWVISVLGALAGGLLLFLYERWALRSSFRAWSILASGEGKLSTPSWRKLWWWVLLSYLALFGGVAAGVMLQQVLAA